MITPSNPELSELTRRGIAIYESKLKTLLEAEQKNRFVAIHPDTEEYAVGRTSGDAMRAMHKIHPEGQVVIMKIGTEPEYGLAARILASELREGARK